jgi:hypothetical protein
MDEKEYKDVYLSIAAVPCLFEKSILALKLSCCHALRKNIAEREAVVCTSIICHQNCDTWLQLVRNKSQFVLHQTEVVAPLPHAKELKVQVGGIRGLNLLLEQESGDGDLDIAELLDATIAKYDDLESVPFAEVVQSVAHFKGRKRSQ